MYEAALFSPTGGVLAVAGIGGSTRDAGAAAARRRCAARGCSSRTRQIEPAPTAASCCASSCPVNSGDRLDPLQLLQVIEPVPRALAQDAEKVQAGCARLPGDLVLARGAEAPVRADADADAAARAHLARSGSRSCCPSASPRRSGCSPKARARSRRAISRAASRSTSRDELGVLTESFNTMTAQLAEAQREDRGVAARDRDDARLSRKHPRQPVGRRAGVRRPLPAAHGEPERRGDPAAAARRPDRRAARRLGRAGCRRSRRSPSSSPKAFAAAATASGSARRELTVANLTRTLLMRGSRLPGAPVAGYVVVFDDVSELVQAQRDAAWAEVARRLAHEIKNPLTPIQLSAERLAVKLDGAARGRRRRRRCGAARRRSSSQVARDEAHGRRFRDLRAAAAARARCSRSTWPPSCSTCSRCTTICARTSSLSLPDAPGRHPGRAHPPAPGVPQSPAECDRCPGRRRRPALRDRARRRATARRRSSFADHGPGFARRRARARVRAVRDDQGEGHRPRPRDREEDRRRARRPRRARERAAARRARDARVSRCATAPRRR